MSDLLRIATAGSVDDGKSTLIGRLLLDSKQLLDDQHEDDLAHVTDGLRAEREQGITIDVAYRYFATPRRTFILADTPGHERYTRNMVTSASTADLALILVDVRKGLLEQSRRLHRFERFVEATGHVTDAERAGWSFVFAGRLPDDFPPTRALVAAPWWRQVHGASWREPDGPGSAARPDHPVVHVSHDDALAFCAWAGARLPTEVEWEYAARGGVNGTRFPWGDELGTATCNVFRGRFPSGSAGTVPVDAFDPNGFDLHNVIGNVWEWCADPFAPGVPVTRGGSYTCHDSHCTRYRLPARTGSAPDTSMGNLGFRCAG